MYDLDDHEDVNDVDMVVKVRMGCMHLVFINYFVSSLTVSLLAERTFVWIFLETRISFKNTAGVYWGLL